VLKVQQTIRNYIEDFNYIIYFSIYFEIVNKEKVREKNIKFVKYFNKFFAIKVINLKFISNKI